MSDPSGQGCNSNYCPVGSNSFENGGKSGRLCAVLLTPAAALATVLIYAGQTATGNPIAALQAPASGASVSIDFAQNMPTYAGGFTAVVAGTGAVAYVYSKPLN